MQVMFETVALSAFDATEPSLKKLKIFRFKYLNKRNVFKIIRKKVLKIKAHWCNFKIFSVLKI